MSSCESVFIHGEERIMRLNEMRLFICLDEKGNLVRDIPEMNEVVERLIDMCYEMDSVFFKQKYDEMKDYDTSHLPFN